MRQDLQQQQSLTQRLRLTSQQVRYVRLLEMNEQEAEAAVERELDDNPALEKVDRPAPEPRFYSRDMTADRPDYTPVDADDSESLAEHLAAQIGERSLPEEVRKTALYILGNLDSNGYLQRSEQAMIDDLAFGPGLEIDMPTMHRALALVQSLDPAGVGATNLQETLRLQLERMCSSQQQEDALRILNEGFEEFSMKHIHKLVSKLKLPAERVERAVALIRTLNPKPGSAVGTGRADMAAAVVPDFQVDVADDGEITLSFSGNIPALAVEESFEQAYRRLKENRQAVADNWNLEGLRSHYLNLYLMQTDLRYTVDDLNELSPKDVADFIKERGKLMFRLREEELGTEILREVERVCLLKSVDKHWMDHIDAMDELRQGIGLRGYAQKNPVDEYRFEGYNMFDEMIAAIREETVRAALCVPIRANAPIQRERVMNPDAPNAGSNTPYRSAERAAKKAKKARK